MTMRAFHVLALGLAFPAPAFAQAVPDLGELVTQSEQINRGVEQATRNRVRSGEDAATALDGEAGIYVLTVNRIFAITASGGIGYTDNPERTADDSRGSFFGDAALAVGVATRLGQRVDFGLSATIAGREFFEAGSPSSRNLSGALSVGLPVAGPVYAGAVVFGGYSFDGKFRNAIGFYGIAGSLSAALPVTSRFVIRPGVGGNRQWSEVAENNSSLIAASVDLLFLAEPNLTASLTGRASRRWYDDFFEDVTFVARRDTSYGLTAALAWQPLANVSIAATFSYERQHSRFFLADFHAFEGTAGGSVHLRF